MDTAADYLAVENLIAGQWQPGTGTSIIDVHNPANGEVITSFLSSSRYDVDAAVAAARAAQPGWAAKSARERSSVLRHLALAFERDLQHFVELEVLDAGKPITAASTEELPDIVDAIHFFAGAARSLTSQSASEYVAGKTSFVRREPVGVVAGITPWNYPLWQAIWKIIPALAVGNSVVIKPAENTPLGATTFARLASEHLPEGVLNVVHGFGATVGEYLAGHAGVNLVSFTGSTTTGRAIATAAATGPRRTVLELGGNAPVIVFDDANVQRTAQAVVAAGLYNGGQECMAATRLIVQDSVVEELITALIEHLDQVVIGDPTDEKTTLGPLISAAQRDRVIRLIEGRPSRSTLLYGGKPIDGPGYFVAPTVIGGLAQDDDLVQQEIFGPVLTLQTFSDENEATAMANGVDFGLAGSVWTREVSRGLRIVNALNFGNVWINSHLVVSADLPIGGFNQSGYGKEGAVSGVEEFTRVKAIGIDLELAD